MSVLRVTAFAVTGAVAGYLCEMLSRAFGLGALAPFIAELLLLFGIAVRLRRAELLEFVLRAFAFAYAMFLSISAVRYTATQHIIYYWLNGHASKKPNPIEELSIVIGLGGVAVAVLMVAASFVVWVLAQRLDRPKRDARATAFLHFLDERKN